MAWLVGYMSDKEAEAAMEAFGAEAVVLGTEAVAAMVARWKEDPAEDARVIAIDIDGEAAYILAVLQTVGGLYSLSRRIRTCTNTPSS